MYKNYIDFLESLNKKVFIILYSLCLIVAPLLLAGISLYFSYHTSDFVFVEENFSNKLISSLSIFFLFEAVILIFYTILHFIKNTFFQWNSAYKLLIFSFLTIGYFYLYNNLSDKIEFNDFALFVVSVLTISIYVIYLFVLTVIKNNESNNLETKSEVISEEEIVSKMNLIKESLNKNEEIKSSKEVKEVKTTQPAKNKKRKNKKKKK